MEPIVPAGKEATILVAGRLGEIQKGPEQTARTLRLLLREDSEVQVELHIRGRLTPEFASLAKASPRVRVCENTSREQLAERLRSVAILFSRSRWETTPVIALEALCSGCTLVAPRELPGYQSLIQEGRFGQTYERNSDQDAVQAIRGELNRWRTGGRDSAGIAAHWRKRASLPNVVEELLELRGRDSRIQVTEQTTAIGNATPIHS
jgi:glycosyltransferase involved in cell wall biosynthesis